MGTETNGFDPGEENESIRWGQVGLQVTRLERGVHLEAPLCPGSSCPPPPSVLLGSPQGGSPGRQLEPNQGRPSGPRSHEHPTSCPSPTRCMCAEQHPDSQPFVRCWTRGGSPLGVLASSSVKHDGRRWVGPIPGWVFLWSFEGFGKARGIWERKKLGCLWYSINFPSRAGAPQRVLWRGWRGLGGAEVQVRWRYRSSRLSCPEPCLLSGPWILPLIPSLLG